MSLLRFQRFSLAPTRTRSALASAALCLGVALAGSHTGLAHAITEAKAAVPPAARPAAAQRTIWIDVRTPAEFAQGHLAGSLNIPLDQIAQHIGKHVPDKNTRIAVYCRSGNRSEQARQILQRMGYAAVSNEGGYADLMRRGVKAQ